MASRMAIDRAPRQFLDSSIADGDPRVVEFPGQLVRVEPLPGQRQAARIGHSKSPFTSDSIDAARDLAFADP
jgi:hypothetical protein